MTGLDTSDAINQHEVLPNPPWTIGHSLAEHASQQSQGVHRVRLGCRAQYSGHERLQVNRFQRPSDRFI